MVGAVGDLAAARLRRWRPPRAVRTLRGAAHHVEDLGFCLVFPSRGIELPTLLGAVTDLLPERTRDWFTEDVARVWGWKDELAANDLAWYGRFLRGRPSLLSPGLLADLYPRRGEPADFADAPLSATARRIAEIVLLSGPTSTAILREEMDAYRGRGRGRFEAALTELGRQLVIGTVGVEEQGAGWPASVLELTARRFDVARRGRDPAAGRRRAGRRFLATMVEARPHELGNAFGWRAAGARAVLEHLVERGEARRSGAVYRPAISGGTRSRQGRAASS